MTNRCVDCGVTPWDEKAERCNDCEETYQLKLDAEWVRRVRLESERMGARFQAKVDKIMENKDG